MCLFHDHDLLSLVVVTCIYVYIFQKYNLLNLYNATCMYDFEVEHLVLDSQLVCYSLGKTISPALSLS